MALKYAQEQCDNILDRVHASQLHFLVQETPFSLYLTVRKKINSKNHKSSIPQEPKEDKSCSSDLKVQLEKSSDIIEVQRDELDKAKDIIASLESKLVKAEKELLKLSSIHKLKSDESMEENKLLKESIKKSNGEATDSKKVLSETKKLLKNKEKENHNLEQRLENSLVTNKTLRQNNLELKKENKKLDKSNKQFEKNAAIQKKVETNQKLVEVHTNKISKLTSPESDIFVNNLSTSPTFSDNNNIVAMKDSTPTINIDTSSNTKTASSGSEFMGAMGATKAETETFFTVEQVKEAIEKALKKQTNTIKKFWQSDD